MILTRSSHNYYCSRKWKVFILPLDIYLRYWHHSGTWYIECCHLRCFGVFCFNCSLRRVTFPPCDLCRCIGYTNKCLSQKMYHDLITYLCNYICVVCIVYFMWNECYWLMLQLPQNVTSTVCDVIYRNIKPNIDTMPLNIRVVTLSKSTQSIQQSTMPTLSPLTGIVITTNSGATIVTMTTVYIYCRGITEIRNLLSYFKWYHDDVIKWKHFPRYWPFVRGIHRSPVNSPHKGRWRGALMFSLICVWINGWVNNHEPDDLRRYRAHYDVIVLPLQHI